MKYVLMLLLAILSFAGTLALALFLSGNLNGEGIQKLMGNAPEVVEAEDIPEDPLGPLARQLKNKEEELSQLEARLKQREAQLNTREESLQQLSDKLDTLREQLDTSIASAEESRQQEIATVANTLTEMKADKAAEALRSFPVEDQAAILMKIEKSKDRGRIVEAMDANDASRVLQAMQEQPF
jgi:flagellar motility protein MotE (MotC chaperone)